MSRNAPQLNIRSARAHARARMLTRRTGLTTTQVVEQALDAFDPPAPVPLAADDDALPPGMIRKGWLLVFTGGPPVTLEQINASIEEDRNSRGEIIG